MTFEQDSNETIAMRLSWYAGWATDLDLTLSDSFGESVKMRSRKPSDWCTPGCPEHCTGWPYHLEYQLRLG